jgi:Short C-terminal domain
MNTLRPTCLLPILLSALITAGCATSEIIPMGTDTYMISQTSAGGVFTNMSALKSEVIKRANAFAESKGKVAIPLASNTTPPAPGQMPNFEYQFRLVDKNDPRATGAALVPRPDMVVENNINVPPSSGGAKDEPKSKDLYAELVKLDDLRKRGIITDEEFEAQKQRLLSGN